MPKGPISRDEVIEKTLSGIVKAQQDYEAWSGGRWLWKAPEYMLTTYIAREICTIEGSYYLTLESNVKETVENAGGTGRGGLHEAVRPSGRFDITLYWGNRYPRAVIEVKNQVAIAGDIKEDIIRVQTLLRNKKNKFQFGLIAFYTSRRKKRGDSGGARAKIEERLENIECGTRDILREGYRLSRHDIPIKGDDDDAWVASVLRVQ